MPEAKRTVLFSNDWVELRSMECPEMGIEGYVYAHEKRTGGILVAVLPFYRNVDGNLVAVLRTEVVPPWGLRAEACAVTGGAEDEGESYDGVALREMEEETGFKAGFDRVIPLGTCRGTKCLDTTYRLYAVDVTGLDPGPALGDGSELERLGGTMRTLHPEECADPVVSVMWARLRACLI